MSIAVLFPGQGVQKKGMGKWLYDNFLVSKQTFEEASDCLGMDVAKLCFEEEEKLSQVDITQPIILTVSIAAVRALEEEKGIKFNYGAGPSLGEYSALTAAGALEFSDALKIVSFRGKFMHEAVKENKGAMCAINGSDPETVAQIVRKLQKDNLQVEISNYNSLHQTVVAGLKEDVAKLEEIAKEKNISTTRLKVNAPFHSSLMKPVKEKMKEVLKDIQIHSLSYPVISNVTGVPYYDTNHMKEALIEQITRPVEWTKSMSFLYEAGVDQVIDVGPGEVVKNLMIRNYRDINSLSVLKDWERIGITAARKGEK